VHPSRRVAEAPRGPREYTGGALLIDVFFGDNRNILEKKSCKIAYKKRGPKSYFTKTSWKITDFTDFSGFGVFGVFPPFPGNSPKIAKITLKSGKNVHFQEFSGKMTFVTSFCGSYTSFFVIFILKVYFL